MPFRRSTKLFALVTLALLASYLLLRKVPQLIRPAIEPQTILVNPGARWSWLDPYALFTLSDGDAFYTVVDLRSKKVVRDSTWPIIPITAYSQGSVGMGRSVFFWSADGRSAAFPGGEGPAYIWENIHECAGEKSASPYSNLECSLDKQSPQCSAIRNMIE
jgi:hypothetical protein